MKHKLRKTFSYQGIDLRIVDQEENGSITTRVLAPNGSVVPVPIRSNAALKNIIQDTFLLLDAYADDGVDVIKGLTKKFDIETT